MKLPGSDLYINTQDQSADPANHRPNIRLESLSLAENKNTIVYVFVGDQYDNNTLEPVLVEARRRREGGKEVVGRKKVHLAGAVLEGSAGI